MRFNQLSDEEEEILDKLQEECAEVIQAIAKVKAHGYLSTHPNGGEDNLETMLRELGDLSFVTDLWSRSMDQNLDPDKIHRSNHNINQAKIIRYAMEKQAKMPKYTHHIDWSKYL